MHDVAISFPPPIRPPALESGAGSTALDPMARPDWVICGGPAPGGVYLLASQTLDKAELNLRYAEPEMFSLLDGPIHRRHVKTRIFLVVEMNDFVMIYAATYRDAFNFLFTQWRPDDTGRPALGR